MMDQVIIAMVLLIVAVCMGVLIKKKLLWCVYIMVPIIMVSCIGLTGCGSSKSSSSSSSSTTATTKDDGFFKKTPVTPNPYEKYKNSPNDSAEFFAYYVNQYLGPYFNEERDAVDKVVVAHPEKEVYVKIGNKNQWTKSSGSEYIYRGELNNNMPNGKGAVYKKIFMMNNVYAQLERGEFKDGILNGYGQLYRGRTEGIKDSIYAVTAGYKFGDEKSLLYYEGNIKNGYADGHGILFDGKYTFEGTFKHGKLNGFCKVFYEGKLQYEGNYVGDDMYNGKGILYYPNGTKEYEGEFKHGSYNGEGTSYKKDGSVDYKGKWKNGDYDN